MALNYDFLQNLNCIIDQKLIYNANVINIDLPKFITPIYG